jgi:hypothetical protein
MTDQKDVLINQFETLDISDPPKTSSSNRLITQKKLNVVISRDSHITALKGSSNPSISPFKDDIKSRQGSGTLLRGRSTTLKLANSSKSTSSHTWNNVPTPQTPNTLEALLKRVTQSEFDASRAFERVSGDHSFFSRADQLRVKYNISPEAFENFKRLSCGIRGFPCIVLQNPKNDLLEFEQMIKKTPTLQWIDDTLRELGLSIDDVIVIDLFPMLTDDWLEKNTQRRAQAIEDMFELTLDFIHEFKLPVVLSCQCFNAKRPQCFKAEPGPWASFTHPNAGDLRSSMEGARKRKVSQFKYKGHMAYVVHGFHPASQFRKKESECQVGLEPLRKIFHSLFGYYAKLLKDFEDRMMLENHERHKKMIRKLINALYQKAIEFGESHEQGLARGLFQDHDDSRILGDWNDLRSTLDPILNTLPSKSSA